MAQLLYKTPIFLTTKVVQKGWMSKKGGEFINEKNA